MKGHLWKKFQLKQLWAALLEIMKALLFATMILLGAIIFVLCCLWINRAFCYFLWIFKLSFLDCFNFCLTLPQVTLPLNDKGKIRKTSSDKQMTGIQGTLPQQYICESSLKSVLRFIKQSIVAGRNDSVEAGSLVV